MADYPTLPIAKLKELPGDYGVTKTEFEFGYRQTRPTRTKAARRYEIDHETLTAAEATTWKSFWDARTGGGEAFNFTDPRTSNVVVVQFDDDGGQPPVESKGSTQVFDIKGIRLIEQL